MKKLALTIIAACLALSMATKTAHIRPDSLTD